MEKIGLTTKKIVEIHDYVIEEFGGTKGILCSGSIDFLIDKLEIESNNFKKAAIALDGIITNHPFVDGHKRTALQVANIILKYENCYIINLDKLERKKVLVKIASYECKINDIEIWLKRICYQLEKSR